MRDPKRIEKILALLREIWVINADCRLGQILTNAAHLCRNEGSCNAPKSSGATPDLFYIEDDVMIKALEEYLKRAKASVFAIDDVCSEEETKRRIELARVGLDKMTKKGG